MELSFEGATECMTLPERLEQHARQRPHDIALQCGADRIDWRSLQDRVVQVALMLRGAGCSPGDRVALLAKNGTTYLECFLGIVRGGYCAVTLPTNLSTSGLSKALSDCACRAIFVSGDFRDDAVTAIDAAAAHVHVQIALDFEADGWEAYDRWRAMAPMGAGLDPVSLDMDFNIIYSSGTTAAPKGILHTHRSRMRTARAMARLGEGPDSATLVATALYTNFGLPAFLASIWRGGRTVVQRKFEPREFLRIAAQERITHFFLVPAQLTRLLSVAEFESTDLSASRLVYVSGSRFDVALKQQMLQRWPGEILEVYGMTEGAPVSAHGLRAAADVLESVGRPVGEVRILDDAGVELPCGSVGEIAGHTHAMMKGYFNQPAATEELIWRDGSGVPYFRSGDLGFLDARGFLHVVDRKKDVVISGGLNVYAADIEIVLAEHPDIIDAAVIGAPSERWGETPLAIVVPAPAASLSEQDVKDWLNTRVAKHQRVSEVIFASSLPRNAMGKVLKRELRLQYAQ